MSKRSRDKGKRGEREFAQVLRDELHCPDACRGVQHAGGPDSPDVRNGIPGVHFEVKRCERLSLYEAMGQAEQDSGDNIPVVAHRRNGQPWVVIVRATDLPVLATQMFLQMAD